MLYTRLDDLRERTACRLARTLTEGDGTPRGLAERDAAAHRYADRLAQVEAAEHGLCFGRLDLHGGERRYVGRIGLFAESAEGDPLLVDWRASAARPFYVATAVSPEGVRRRRHLRTRRRTVTGVDDEVLDSTAGPGTDAGPAGEAALLAALTADRTGRMADIVETLQAEQDRIVRSSHPGVLVVQGGPGTGKTAVALHRAAYLLYTHRDRLARRGVLVVGPSPAFLGYVGQVLPALGETGVVLATLGDLFPGTPAHAEESPASAEIKGRAAMTEVLAAAVRDRQRAPADGLEVVVDRQRLRVGPNRCARARDRARATRLPHNQARPVFLAEMLDALAAAAAARLSAGIEAGADLLGADEIEDLRRDLAAAPGVRAALNDLWPALTPQRLLADLFADPTRLAAAAPGLPAAERDLLRRAPDADWAEADVPLLDEAAELLGTDDRAERARRERGRRAEVDYAQGVLDIVTGSRSIDAEDEADPETFSAADLMDAAALADRLEAGPRGTVAERAAADRTWTFGHVIVDEAQELSPMAWRLLMRRCPSRSMTVVGDLAQTGDLSGASSWAEIFTPYVGDRWRLERLTVNYRTPAEIMAVAGRLRRDDEAPRSVRSGGVRPWREPIGPAGVGPIVAREAAAVGAGRLAVLVPTALLDEVRRQVVAAVPGATGGAGADLTGTVVVLSVRQAKGLEFDTVIVVEPARILAESLRGRGDLYVALTRATRRLGIVHTGELPVPPGPVSPRR
ncbi:helicase [Actinomadura craniellae]|uniref:Helicase n=2 Tax=Actinomadura craniellae TaxID=2231787 RepID=A0A365GWD6_9ACTN|nr:helicase [Actinomadura craniellae]